MLCCHSSPQASWFEASLDGAIELHSHESSGEVCQLVILPNLHPTSSREGSTKGIKGDKQYKSNMV